MVNVRNFIDSLREDVRHAGAELAHLVHSQPLDRALAALDEIAVEFDKLGLDHGVVGDAVQAVQLLAQILLDPNHTVPAPAPAPAPAGAPEGGAADAGTGA
jgi:hypothetical protein